MAGKTRQQTRQQHRAASIMRALCFDGDNREHHIVFNMLQSAWYFTDERGFSLIQTATSAERVENAIDITEQFESLRVEVGRHEFDLSAQGGSMGLRDSALDLLREAWTAYKRLVPPPFAKNVKLTDDYLRDVPREVTP